MYTLDDQLENLFMAIAFSRNLRRGDERKRAVAYIAIQKAKESDSDLVKRATLTHYRNFSLVGIR